MAKNTAKGGRLIKAAQHITPHEQGILDGLCGLYATINAIRLARWPYAKLTTQEALELFEAGIYHLRELGDLSEIVRIGMPPEILTEVAHMLCLQASIKPLALHVEVTEEDRPDAECHILARAAIDNDTPVIFHIDSQEHYSVLSGYSKHRYRIFDSAGGHYLHKQTTTLGFMLSIHCGPRPEGWKGH